MTEIVRFISTFLLTWALPHPTWLGVCLPQLVLEVLLNELVRLNNCLELMLGSLLRLRLLSILVVVPSDVLDLMQDLCHFFFVLDVRVVLLLDEVVLWQVAQHSIWTCVLLRL